MEIDYAVSRDTLGARKRRVWASLGVGLGVYLLLPVVAGYFEIGDRRGPAVYPEFAHGILYRVGYSMNSDRVGKPRVSWNAPPRPWFYGLD